MLANLGLGTLLIATTVITHTVGLIFLHRAMAGVVGWAGLHRHDAGKMVAMVVTVFGLFFLHTIEIWTWAIAYLASHAMKTLDGALYFSATTFSTLGYGDITLPFEWRIFGALEGVNGFLLIGWSTAYLVAASTRYGPFRAGEHF